MFINIGSYQIPVPKSCHTHFISVPLSIFHIKFIVAYFHLFIPKAKKQNPLTLASFFSSHRQKQRATDAAHCQVYNGNYPGQVFPWLSYWLTPSGYSASIFGYTAVISVYPFMKTGHSSGRKGHPFVR